MRKFNVISYYRLIIVHVSCRLCRAIALAANGVKLTVIEGKEPKSILDAVLDAQKNPSTESLDGFLALTDSVIYAIKVANPTGLSDTEDDSQKLVTVRFSIV